MNNNAVGLHGVRTGVRSEICLKEAFRIVYVRMGHILDFSTRKKLDDLIRMIR